MVYGKQTRSAVLFCCAVCYYYSIIHTPAIHLHTALLLQLLVFLLYSTLPLYSVQHTVFTPLINPPLSSIPLPLSLPPSLVVGRSRCDNCDTANAVTRTYLLPLYTSLTVKYRASLASRARARTLASQRTYLTHTQPRRSPPACPASPVLSHAWREVRCPCVCVCVCVCLRGCRGTRSRAGLHSDRRSKQKQLFPSGHGRDESCSMAAVPPT
jgi:hypothetical protein